MTAPGPRPAPTDLDQRVFLHGLTYADYELLDARRGESANPRLTFDGDTLEVMSPSHDHEQIKKNLARLLEAWSLQQHIRLQGIGSWTLKHAELRKGLEPDECYMIGRERKTRPDIAIEVVVSSGGLEKLPIYRALGVPEVWIWEGGSLSVHTLGDDGYAEGTSSGLLPTLDMSRLADCAVIPDQVDALAAFLGIDLE